MLRCLACAAGGGCDGRAGGTPQPQGEGSGDRPPLDPAQPNGAAAARVYMIIKNASGKSDRLLSASTQRADKVELHSAGKGAAAFVVRNGKELALYGDGPSLVLTGLKKPLHAYDDFKMTLVFEKAGPVAIDVMVEEE